MNGSQRRINEKHERLPCSFNLAGMRSLCTRALPPLFASCRPLYFEYEQEERKGGPGLPVGKESGPVERNGKAESETERRKQNDECYRPVVRDPCPRQVFFYARSPLPRETQGRNADASGSRSTVERKIRASCDFLLPRLSEICALNGRETEGGEE